MSLEKKGEKLTEQIYAVMREKPETRNSDVALTVEIWKKFYPDHLIVGSTGNPIGVILGALFELPREDHVKRYRAKIQNELKILIPTDPKVAKQRKWLYSEWTELMRQSVQIRMEL